MADRVTCINKDDRKNPYERITHIGGNANGTSWRITQADAISSIKSGRRQFYVQVGTSTVNVLVAVSHHGNEYIKTERDNQEPNNLLSLPECK